VDGLMKAVDVFPGSSRLVEGEVPSQSLLLLGPSGIGKTIFCKQFLYNGLLLGEPCIYVATDESPEEISKSMKSFGFDIEPYKKKGKFRIIDCYSWKLGGRSSSEYIVNNPADLATISMSIDKARRDLKKIRLVLDSITGLTSICNHNVTIFSKFLQIIVARIRLMHGNAIFTAAPEAHEKQFLSFLRLIFDGTLEMKEDESGKDIKRLLRIFSFKGAKHRTYWNQFEITDKGIKVKSDIELRCAMCSKLIDWKPYVEEIEGKKHNFDSSECARTYKKLKSLYGEDFE
jgi:KaiC/GvpD/RAD55 family RecA-like ATPase